MADWLIVITLTVGLFVITFLVGERLARKKSGGRPAEELVDSTAPEECES